MPRTGKLGRTRQLWAIIAHDPLALTELLSGVFLVALRGALIIGAPRLVYVDYEVASLLRQIHVTENLWGSYLMVCGLAQIGLAGTRHATLRTLVTLATLFGIVVMTTAFWRTDGFWGVPVSLHCMSAFYTFLLARVLSDRKDQLEREAIANGQ